jgi:hypothetical protein
LSIVPCQPHRFAVEILNLSLDSFARLHQRLDHGSKLMAILRQFRNAYGEYIHLRTADHQPKVLEEPTDLILEISLNLDEQSSADEKSLDSVTVEVFNAHLLVPSALHNARDADSVVAIGL